MNIAIIGSNFGLALAYRLARGRHRVSLFIRHQADVDAWRAAQEPIGVPWAEGRKLPKNLHIFPLAEFTEDNAYAFIIPVVSVDDLFALVAAGHFSAEGTTPFILCQKGLLPDGGTPFMKMEGLVSPERPILLFTGAAFAADLVTEAPVMMVTASRRKWSNIADTWHSSTKDLGIIPVRSENPERIAKANGVRTVISLMQGIGSGALKAKYGLAHRSTLAAFEAGLGAEADRLVDFPASNRERHEADRVDVALAADLLLCADSKSRNFQLGLLLAEGIPLEKALTSLPGVAESVANAHALIDLVDYRLREFVFLSGLRDFLAGTHSLDEVVDAIMRRQFGA